MAEPKQFTIEDTQIMFRNFEGIKKQFNAAGDRNFCAVLHPELAHQLAADGWNVKELAPRDEDEDPIPYIKVKLNYSNRPPKVFVVTESGRTQLGEGAVEQLDSADIKKVDMIVNGFDYELADGKRGTSAYLQTLFVILDEDELERKYGVYKGASAAPEAPDHD